MATISDVATISALKAVTGMASGDVAIVRGYYEDADGGSGEFAYQDTAPIVAKVNKVTGSPTIPITITTEEPNIFQTGGQVQISGVTGFSGANGTFTIIVTSANQFTLIGTVGAGGMYVDGGDIAYADQGTTIFPSSGLGQWKRIVTDHISVKYFGAKGDISDTSRVAAAINAVGQSGGGYVDFPPGHYRLNGQLVLPSGVTLRGAGRNSTILDFTLWGKDSVDTAAAILSTGALGATLLLDVDAPKGATTLSVKEPGKSVQEYHPAAGDRIVLGSNDLFYGMPATDSNPDRVQGPKGERCIVYAVDRVKDEKVKGDKYILKITLVSPTMDFYTTAKQAQIQLVNQVIDVGVRDMTILRANQNRVDSFGLWFENAERVRIENAVVQYATYTGIQLSSVLDAVVNNCSILDTYFDPPYDQILHLQRGGTSYGIEIGNASQDVRVTGCYLRRFRHGVSIGKNTSFGVPRRIDIVGNCFDKTSEADSIAGAVDIGHFMTQFVSFVGNVVVAPQSVPALSLDGFDHLISNNLLIGGGIELGTGNDGLSVPFPAIDAYSRIAILSNKIKALPGSTGPGINLKTSGNTVIGNDIDLTGSVGGNADGITVSASQTVRQLADNVISNNKVTNPNGGAGISVYGSTRTSIVGNQIELNPESIVNQNPVFFYSQLNDLKAHFNGHIIKAKPVHVNADAVDVLYHADATDQKTANDLVDTLCETYAVHIMKGGQPGPNNPGVQIHLEAETQPVFPAIPTDPTGYARFIELQRVYNLHVGNLSGKWHLIPDAANDTTTLVGQHPPTYGIYVEDHGTTPCSSVDVDENRISDPSGMSILDGIKFNTSKGATDCSYGRNAFTLARSGSTAFSASAGMLYPRHQGPMIFDYSQTWSATPAFNWANGNYQYITLGGNTSPTFTNMQAGAYYELHIVQGTGGQTVTWPSTVKWPNATAPILSTGAGKRDIFAFSSDGTTLWGRTLGLQY